MIESDPIEVSEDVFRIPLPHPSRNFPSYCYVIRGVKEGALIDAGWGTTQCLESLLRALEKLSISPEGIGQVVITHGHPDHFGLAGEFQKKYGSLVFLHKNDLKRVKGYFLGIDEHIAQMKWFWKYGVSDEHLNEVVDSNVFKPSINVGEPDILLTGDEDVVLAGKSLRIRWTPGHTFGHICLYLEKQNILFAGDHLLYDISPNIGYGIWYDSNPLGDYLDSLDTVQNLDVDLVLPAHGAIFRDMRSRIEQIRVHHEKRIEEILTALDGMDKKTAWELARRVSWSPGHFDLLDSFKKRQAISETLAHLQYLVATGEVRRNEVDERVFFTK